MSDFQIEGGLYKYEAQLTYVSPEYGYHNSHFLNIPEPTIDAVMETGFSSKALDLLAWVRLTRCALVTITHDTENENDFLKKNVYLIPDYPTEKIRGVRVYAKDTYLVTDKTEDGLVFQTERQILKNGVVPTRTTSWLGKLAQGSIYANSFKEIQELSGIQSARHS